MVHLFNQMLFGIPEWNQGEAVKIFRNVALILRAYNNNPDSRKAVVRAINNGIGLVVVVIKGHDEHDRGRVRKDIDPLMSEHGERIVAIEMTEGYSWSNALNVAVEHIRFHNMVREINNEQGIEYLFTCSIETMWQRDHLDAMLNAMYDSERIAVVGTSFEGRLHGNRVKLGRSYIHPRNTGMLIRWQAMKKVGSFNAVCDGMGGMEDLFFTIMAVMMGLDWRMLDLLVPLILGKNYDQEMKEQREQAAMDKIVSYFKAMAGTQLVTDRLKATLRRFQLENN